MARQGSSIKDRLALFEQKLGKTPPPVSSSDKSAGVQQRIGKISEARSALLASRSDSNETPVIEPYKVKALSSATSQPLPISPKAFCPAQVFNSLNLPYENNKNK